MADIYLPIFTFFSPSYESPMNPLFEVSDPLALFLSLLLLLLLSCFSHVRLCATP